MKDQQAVQDYLLSILLDLYGVQQDHYFHPEGDALFHSLQVFEIALQSSDDSLLLTAALFHDVGKAHTSKNHETIGAEMLTGILNKEIVWLIQHHLDLLKHPAQTKKCLSRYPKDQHRLLQLQHLRKWDIAGRNPYAEVMRAEHAVSIIIKRENIFI